MDSIVRKRPKKKLVAADPAPMLTVARAKVALRPHRGSSKATAWDRHRPNYYRGSR